MRAYGVFMFMSFEVTGVVMLTRFFLLVVIAGGFIVPASWFLPVEAHAVPAFARKYNVNCTVCHTRPPRLNPFGERFLENGYQMPGTEDGGITKKRRLGDLTLDDVTNILAFRLKGSFLRNFDYAKNASGPGIAGNPEDRTEFSWPASFNLFTTGTLTTNVGFFFELENDFQTGETESERAFVTFNNLGGHDLLHLRIGKLDPSAYFSYPLHRQQFDFVPPDSTSGTLNQIPLSANAFAAKMYGLLKRDGTSISPFSASLYNAGEETGIDIHGRPFGRWFLYQVGILNGANESFGDSNNPKDWYVMFRLDQAESDLFSANISGFAYFGNNNAKVSTGSFTPDVDWSRYGLAATLRYKMVDVYGAFVIDRVTNLPQALAASFDSTATGLTLTTDILMTDRVLMSLRFDYMDAGGVLATRKSNTLMAIQAKYFLRTNIALYVRDDFNLREAEGGTSAARNFRNAFLIGADLIY